MKKSFAAFFLCFALLSQTLTSYAAAISITAASFVPSSAAFYLPGKNIAGAGITQGQAVYVDTNVSVSSGQIKLASATGTGLATQVIGLAANSASPGQPIKVLIRDPGLALGGTIAAGDVLMLHTTAGALTVTPADLTTGAFIAVLGVGTGSNKVNFGGTKFGNNYIGIIRADVAK